MARKTEKMSANSFRFMNFTLKLIEFIYSILKEGEHIWNI